MRVIVDGFGGDNSPLSVIKGCELAKKKYKTDITIVGNSELINKVADENNISLKGILIENADDIIKMEDEPTSILKLHSESSMAIGFKLLAEGKGDAFISAGSTGAMVVGATLIIKRIKGIKRLAIGTLIPSPNGEVFLIDSGANNECRPEMLKQFAIMGSTYMKLIENSISPRIGLINIGTEETKGTDLQIEAYHLIMNSGLNFVGNIEGSDIINGKCDVAVCDGFTGNVLLKTIEGTAKMFSKYLKSMFLTNKRTKFAALLTKKQIQSFKNEFDANQRGGSLLLGVRKPVIKVHGSSDCYGIMNAIGQAIDCVNNNIINIINTELSKYTVIGDDNDE